MRRLDGTVVLITGASSGIGAALGREFAARGAMVALAARRVDRLHSVADGITADGGTAVPFACDVTREGDLERTVAAIVEQFGRLDIAVANAGFGVAGALEALDLDDYRRQFETNVFGVLRTAYAVLAELKRSHGKLVLLGSVAGYVAAPGASAYAMSKFAVRGLADSLRGELAADGVDVVLILPGFVDSEFRQVDNRGRHHAGAPDPIPAWLRMRTDRAARQIVRAVARGRREKVVTTHGRVAVFMVRHFPRLVRSVATRARARRREPGRRD